MEATETGMLVPDHRGDQLGLRALELSFDYSAIAETLPTKRIAAVRRELRDSTKGNLDPPAHRRTALQLQTQFVVRAALVRAGVFPVHPTHSPKTGKSSPDMLVENGLSTYGLEVKRPEKTKNVARLFDEARDQLGSYGVKGVVVMDLTDCLRDVEPTRVSDEVCQLACELMDRAFIRDIGYHPGYEDIMMVAALARLAWHSKDETHTSMVSVHTSVATILLASKRNTLLDHHAQWFRKALSVGFDRLNVTLGEPRVA
jgi:hypothetical protein